MNPIQFILTTNSAAIKGVYSEDGLYDTVQADNSPSLEDWVVDTTHTLWLTIVIDEKIAGIVQVKPLSPLLAELHIGLFKQYRGALGLELGRRGLIWLRENTTFKKFITFSPIKCDHVLSFIEKLGFKFSGVIHDGICYHGDLQNLLIYEAN